MKTVRAIFEIVFGAIQCGLHDSKTIQNGRFSAELSIELSYVQIGSIEKKLFKF